MDGLTGLRLWAAMVGVATVGGLVIYFGYGTWLYYRHYVLRRGESEAWKLQPRRWPSRKLHRWAIAVAAGNMALGGLLSGTFGYFVLTAGFSALYLEVADYGWAYTIASTVVMFVAIEAAAYYAHRLLHTRPMFKRFHQWHHRLVAPTPYSTVTMHPVEFTMFQLAAFLPALVLPVHYVSFIGLLLYALVFNLMDHSGIRIKHMLPWHSSTSFHDDHHVHFHCNYGQHIAIFDRFHGTHRRHGRRYGKDVFGGRGAPLGASASEQPGTFVEY